MFRHAIVLFAALLVCSAAAAGTVTIEADRDATLIEQADGTLANGSGANLFVGRTSQPEGSIRRGLIRFDLAGALPRAAIVESVSLRLYLDPSNPDTRTVRLYRVLSDWGEGASVSGGGRGAPAEPGDATWIHTFYDTDFWVHAGGHFVGRASAMLDVGESGPYMVESNPRMVRDVRIWSRAPRRNFGWILIGDETTGQTAKSFASREDPDFALRPTLEVTYRMPGARGPR